MAGEKTEKPTEKRLRDARKKGQVAKSQDLSSAVMLISSVTVLWMMGGYIGKGLLDSMRDQLTYAGSFKGDFTREIAFLALWSGIKSFAFALAPIFGFLIIVAALINYFQVGSIFSTEPLKPNPNKMNPAENFKQKFLKSRPYIELVKTVIKMLIACAVVGITLWDARGNIVRLATQPPLVSVYFVGSLLFQIGLRIGLAYIIIGGLDYFLQKYLHRKDLMMSKHEVREEYKETEGNPLIKHKRRQIHREIIAQAMMAAVKRANVVVTNPTHLAIAIEYDKTAMNAPTVVAKGADFMAAKIREIATDEGIPMMRDVPLAHALYELEIDDEIPEELYESVAVVLRWVYQLAEEEGEVASHA